MSIQKSEAHKGVKDYIRFMIEAVNADDPEETDTMVFRAYLENLDDTYNAKWNEFRYNGRSEPFYTYGNFKRDISFSFKVAASSRADLKPLYLKLNYLLTQTAGDYSRTRLRGNWNRVTIGDYLDRVPGVFTNIKINWSKEYPWEIQYFNYADETSGEMFIDGDVKQLPHMLDISCNFSPVHDFIPRKSIANSPFIGPSRELGIGVDVGSPPWYGLDYSKSSANDYDDKSILRNDRDDKEELREEEERKKAEFEADMAEMRKMEEEEREQREEEERLERIRKQEEQDEAERVANDEAGLGYLTNQEVQDYADMEIEEEDDPDWWEDEDDPNFVGPHTVPDNPPPTPPMI
jgi:hypothetical protein